MSTPSPETNDAHRELSAAEISTAEMKELEREVLATKIRKDVEAQFWSHMKGYIFVATTIVSLVGVSIPTLMRGTVDRSVESAVESTVKDETATIEKLTQQRADIAARAVLQLKQHEDEIQAVRTKFQTLSVDGERLNKQAESLRSSFAKLRGIDPEELARQLVVVERLAESPEVKELVTLLAGIEPRIEALEGPAARYEQVTAGQKLDVSNPSRPIGTIIDFSHKYYDTHGAVTPGPNWHFKAPKTGIYHVSAFAGCAQSGGRLSVGLCIDQKPGDTRPNVFLAETGAYTSGTIIGGMTDVALKKDQLIDIRVYAGEVNDSELVAVGTTHVSIHYVQSF